MRAATQEKDQAPSRNNSEHHGNQSFANEDIKTIKAELDSVKSKMAELQSDYSELQRDYQNLSSKPKRVSGWTSGWRKIKNSFHVKPDGDDNGDGYDKPKSPFPIRNRANPRRRLSMS